MAWAAAKFTPKPKQTPASYAQGALSTFGPRIAQGLGQAAAFYSPPLPGADAPDALQGQLARFGEQQYATQEQRIREDLARQLGQSRTQQGFAAQDAARRQAEIARQTTRQRSDILSGAAARGVAAGGQTTVDLAEAQRAGEEGRADVQRALERGELEAAWGAQAVQQQADRELADIQTRRRREELEGAVSASKRRDDDRSEATAWTHSRVNQLRGAGMEEQQARATAIDEARQRYTGVDPTFLEGAFAPPKLARAGRATVKRYGTEVSAARGRKITGRKQEQIRQRPGYAPGQQLLARYLQGAGDQATADGFVSYYASYLREQNPEARSAEITAAVRRVDTLLSLLLYDVGVTT